MPTRRQFLKTAALGSTALAMGRGRWLRQARAHGTVVGRVVAPDGGPVEGARVTLVDSGGSLIGEGRTAPGGEYVVDVVAEGVARIGASRTGLGYSERELAIPEGGLEVETLALPADTHPGRWTRIGDTSPEYLGATNSGTMTADGRILYCHDTRDPLIFDPVTGNKRVVADAGTAQGCHATALLMDGTVLFVGGQQGSDPGSFRNGVPWVKAYDPIADEWRRLPDLNEPRWYPTLTVLPDRRLLVTGGGQPPDARRTASAEIFDPVSQTWSRTGDMLSAAEFGPSCLLFTGEVLRTWFPPQLWNIDTGQWRPAGNFVQAERGYPGHAPHSLVLLRDGRAAAVGVPSSVGPEPAMVELYDPDTERWSLGTSPETVRSFPEVLLLPDGRIFCAGGRKELAGQPGETNQWGYVPLADLYDPTTDVWRALEPMALGREYHALTILAPDGRVIVTAGTGAPAQDGQGTDNRVDAFEPPYMFRGPRPVIESLSNANLQHGSRFEIRFSGTFAPTSVVLMGLNAVTHYVDGGAGRQIELEFTQDGDRLTVTVPGDRIRLPEASYILFLMVDDIPSAGRIVGVWTQGVGVTPSPVVSPNATATGSPTETPGPTATADMHKERVFLPRGES